MKIKDLLINLAEICLYISILIAFVLVIIHSYLSLPIRYVEVCSDKCLFVKDSKGNIYDCSELNEHNKYIKIYVK